MLGKVGMVFALAFCSGALSLAAQEESEGKTYHIGHHTKFVNISFESQADIETIIGTTNHAAGTIAVDHESVTGSVEIRVPVKELKTGIELRDEHLRSSQWLDEAKFPEITFTSKKIEKVKGKDNRVKVTGDLTVHGIKKEKTVEVTWKDIPASVAAKAQFPKGEWIKFAAAFDVTLSEHGITVPDGIANKVEDTWKVKIYLFAGTAEPPKK